MNVNSRSSLRYYAPLICLHHMVKKVNGTILHYEYLFYAGHLFRYLTSQPIKATQPSIPPGSVNEYQLRLERRWQVWFIPLVDVHGMCR